ncbi:hypothetical protein D3C87_1512860 [compost metagenome]
MTNMSLYRELIEHFVKQSKGQAIKLKPEIIQSDYSRYGTFAYIDENNPDSEPILFVIKLRKTHLLGFLFMKYRADWVN